MPRSRDRHNDDYVELLTFNNHTTNIAKSFIDFCIVHRSKRSWSCGRPHIRDTRVPSRLKVQIRDFDFEEQADEFHGHINVSDVNARCRTHFHNINIEHYQGTWSLQYLCVLLGNIILKLHTPQAFIKKFAPLTTRIFSPKTMRTKTYSTIRLVGPCSNTYVAARGERNSLKRDCFSSIEWTLQWS